jgi:hypothetical protein
MIALLRTEWAGSRERQLNPEQNIHALDVAM